MTVTAFLAILTGCAAATSLLTEGVKRFLDGLKIKYASNVIVFIIAMLVGGSATSVHYIVLGISFAPLNMVCILLMGISNWLGAMLGYDRVRQTITQIAASKQR